MNIISQSIDTGHAFMKRALQLSLMGGSRVSPNPFVGAVIVADGRIIGEGYHRQFGGPHAEVNSVASVSGADRPLLRRATMFVTLEPCSHFGKTPPCADLIIRHEIPRVVVAVEDPFLKDYESGIEKMKRAGIDVSTGLLKNQALWINRRFFTAHTLRRPFILLKWAQSSDGFIARADGSPVRLSSDFTALLTHRERALYDAILVGTGTVLSDNPRLNCRLWPNRNPEERPLKVSFDSKRLTGRSTIESGYHVLKAPEQPLSEFLSALYHDHNVTSLMVEGGQQTLESFLTEGLFDEIRIETSPLFLNDGIPAPDPSAAIMRMGLNALTPEVYGGNSIRYFVKNY